MTFTAADSYAWHPEHLGWSEDTLCYFTQIQHLIPYGGTYVEAGVYLGRSLAFMGTIRPDLHLVAIDPWTWERVTGFDYGPEHDEYINRCGGLYQAFKQQMSAWHPGMAYNAIRERSVEGMATIAPASVAMVFIDALHTEEAVRADIVAAQRILKPGGILSGHDYAGDNPVMAAVDGVFGKGSVNVSAWDGPVLPGAEPGRGRCWWVRT